MATRRRCKFDLQLLTTFCSNLKESSSENTVSFWKINLEELERRWKNLISSFEAYVTGEEIDKEDKYIPIKYEEAGKSFRELKAKILDIIAEGPKTDAAAPKRSTLRLPPVEIHTFEGGYSKWPVFRDMFHAVVRKDPSLDDTEKFYYLRSKLSGEAFKVVKDFDMVGDQYELAWEALKNRFENKRLLISDQMKKLFGIQAAQFETLKYMRNVQNSVNDCLS